MDMNVGVYLDISTSLMVLIVLVCYVFNKRSRKEISYHFFILLALQIIIGIMDAYAVGIYAGSVGLRIVIYDLTVLQVLAYHGYCFTETKDKLHFSIFERCAVVALCVMLIIVCEISRYTGWMFTVVGQNAVQGPYYQVGNCVLGMIMLWHAIKAFTKFRIIGIRQAVAWSAYCVFPILAMPFTNKMGSTIIHVANAFAMLIIFLYITIEDEMRAIEIREELGKSQARLLASQIQPHFIFNALSSIRQMSTDEKISELILDFSDYLRMNLDTMTNDKNISFIDELKHTQVYLKIEQLRFGKRLSVFYDLEDIEFDIPPLTLQPIVENAVKHGVCQKIEGGTVIIRTREKADCYEITVLDDGVGFDVNNIDKSRTHVGMENVKARITNMCNGEIDIKSTLGVGTEATIRIYK